MRRARAEVGKGRHERAASIIAKAWPKLKEAARRDALEVWGEAVGGGADGSRWGEAATGWLADGASSSDLLPGVKAVLSAGAVPPAGPWADLAREQDADPAWRDAAAGDQEVSDDEVAEWFSARPSSKPLAAALRDRVESGGAATKRVVAALPELIRRDPTDSLREALVRGLMETDGWTDKAAPAVLWYMQRRAEDREIAAWAAGRLSPPLDDEWLRALWPHAGAGGDPAVRRLVAMDLAEKGEPPGPYAEALADLALSERSWLGRAAGALVGVEDPSPRVVEAVTAALAAGDGGEKEQAFALAHSEDPAGVGAAIPVPWTPGAVEALEERWRSDPPVGHHPLLGPFLASLLFHGRTESVLSLVALLPPPLAPQARLWGAWAALAGGQNRLADRWLEGLDGPGAVYARLRVLEESGERTRALEAYGVEGGGWAAVRAGLLEEREGREERALDAWRGVGESPPGAARYARLCLTRRGEPALREDDIEAAGGGGDALRLEMRIAEALRQAGDGDWQAAERSYREGWTLAEDGRCLQGVVEVAHRWGGELLEAGKARQAREVVERALLVNDDPRLLRQWLGSSPPPAAWPRLVPLAKGDLPPALRSDLGWLGWQAGSGVEAAKVLLQAVREGAEDPLDLARLARVLLEVPIAEGAGEVERLVSRLRESLGAGIADAVHAAQGGKPKVASGLTGKEGVLAGWTLLASGKAEEAAACLRDVLEGPGKHLGTGLDRARGYAVLGYWLLESGDVEGAEQAWERAGHLGLGGGVLEALQAASALERGVMEAEAGRHRRAAGLFSRGLEHPLSREAARRDLAVYHTLNGPLTEALPHWRALAAAWRSREGGAWPRWHNLATEMTALCERLTGEGGVEATDIERAAWEDTVDALRGGLRAYRDLGVAPDATAEEIEGAYFKRIRAFGPEREARSFKRVEEAHARLRDPEERARIDLFRYAAAPRARVRQALAEWGAHPLDTLVPGLPAGPSWRPGEGEGAHDPRPFPVPVRGPFAKVADRWIGWEPLETGSL